MFAVCRLRFSSLWLPAGDRERLASVAVVGHYLRGTLCLVTDDAVDCLETAAHNFGSGGAEIRCPTIERILSWDKLVRDSRDPRFVERGRALESPVL